MRSFVAILLQCSISMSVISLIWMAFLPVLSKRYEAKWLYGICLLLVLGWMIPFRPAVDLSFMFASIPDYAAASVQTAQQLMVETATVLPTAGEDAGGAAYPAWQGVVSAIWIAGFVVYMARQILRHRRLTKLIDRWSRPVTDAKVLGMAERLRRELNIGAQVALKVCPGVASPMLIGLRKPAIVLPSAAISEAELALVLKHEYIHFLRRDLWYKACIMLTAALHWFNPVMHLMVRATAAQCEVSCDAAVLRGADFHQRKRYGQAIIDIMRKQAAPGTAITTHFYGGKQGMKSRIFSIMDARKRKAGFVLLCVVAIAVIGTRAALAANSAIAPPQKNLTEEGKAVNAIIGPISVKQTIPVELDTLEIDEFVAVGGPYTLREGDIVQYDLQGEGDGYLNAALQKTADPGDDKRYLGVSGLTGNRLKDETSFKVKASLAGTYYLWIGNFDGKSLDKDNSSGVLKDIKGIVRIASNEGDGRLRMEGQVSQALEGSAEGGRIETKDGQSLSITLNGGGYLNFGELAFRKGETFVLSASGEEDRELELGVRSIATGEEYGDFVKTGTGKISITIAEDGDYRIYVRNHAADAAHFELVLGKAIEGPIA